MGWNDGLGFRVSELSRVLRPSGPSTLNPGRNFGTDCVARLVDNQFVYALFRFCYHSYLSTLLRPGIIATQALCKNDTRPLGSSG